jgi:hypothetical protein
VNLPQCRAHLLARLYRQAQAQATGDPRLAGLHDELAAYPGGESGRPAATDVVVPLRFRAGQEELSFLSLTAVVGTPMDITVSELAIESFYPADETTVAALNPRRSLFTERSLPPAHPSSPASAGRREECDHGPFGLIQRPPAAAGRPGIYGRGMDDKEIMANIDQLIETEHRLRRQLASGELSAPEEHERLRSAEVALDQCWDLLRQRRARREFGESPDAAAARPVSEVEGYQQ